MSKITIVYPPAIDWHFLHQRPQQLLKSFAKLGVRSVFINPENYKKMEQPITEISDDLFLVRIGEDYKHLLQGKTVLWFSFPPHYVYTKHHDYDMIVFDAIDNPVGEFINWKKDLKAAVELSDVIMSSAKVMYNYHKEHSNKPVYLLPNAGDFEHFNKSVSKLDRPSDLPDFNGEKIVGFYGALHTWVDYDLINKIAEKYKVVLIGSGHFNFSSNNIIQLEHKDYIELPNYLSYFDITMIPFKISEMTNGVNPVKLYEYLSAGKPVIATNMPELKPYDDIVYLVNEDNVLNRIEEALSEDKAKINKRIEIAKKQTWDSRAEFALEIIKKHISEG